MRSKTRRGRPSQAAIEEMRAKVWQLHCEGYTNAEIARHLNLNRKTVTKYTGTMSEEHRELRREQGVDDLEVALAREETVMASCWSALSAIDQELQLEQERRDALNVQREAEGKPPLPRAAWDALGHEHNRVAFLGEFGRACWRHAKLLGLTGSRTNARSVDVSVRWAEFEKNLHRPVVIEMPDLSDIPREFWTTQMQEEMRLLEEQERYGDG